VSGFKSLETEVARNEAFNDIREEAHPVARSETKS
jgi:hypothetical protein